MKFTGAPRSHRATLSFAFMLGCCALSGAKAADSQSTAGEPGVVDMPALRLPLSKFLSSEGRRVKAAEADVWGAVRKCAVDKGAGMQSGAKIGLEMTLRWERAFGECADQLYFDPLLRKQERAFAVETVARTIGGVRVEEFTPRDGIAPKNKDRVLINLHGGGFKSGSIVGGRVESIPIAAQGRIRVISIDYRQGPDHRFPAASEDVVAVYKELLKTHAAKNIGIYGCSAGGTLTAQVLRKLIVERVPVPGAAGLFCAGAFLPAGDSFLIGSAVFAARSPAVKGELPGSHSYFTGTDVADPAVAPGNDPTTLRCFPPSLLISGTRDTAMSAVVHTHTKLMSLGVAADLAIWEGLDHAFFYDPDLPESREVYATVAKFFERSLGNERSSTCS